MSQILDALPTPWPNRIPCGYRNPSASVQIARISSSSHGYCERVAFPGDSLLFEVVTEVNPEIYGGAGITTVWADQIPCDRLQIATPTFFPVVSRRNDDNTIRTDSLALKFSLIKNNVLNTDLSISRS